MKSLTVCARTARGEQKKLTITPVWKFYQPIAATLLRLEGQAKRKDLEEALEVTLNGQLMPGDLEPTGKGVPRWKISVRRARRPMIKAGLIEYARDVWRLTDSGSKLAEKPPGAVERQP